MIRKAYIRNQARKESYLRERRETRELKKAKAVTVKHVSELIDKIFYRN